MDRLTVAYAVFLPIFGGLMVAVVALGIWQKRWQVYVGAGWAALLLIIFLIIGFGFKWFPDTPPDTCPDGVPCFCEAYQTGDVIQQPESVWSDLAFMAAGLFILYLAAAPNASPANPMVDPTSWFPIMLGLIVIFMGPASMFFHASIKSWGGWFDSMSIMFWMIFSLCYSATRLLRWPWWSFLIAWLVLVTIMGLVDIIPSARQFGYYIFGGIWGVLDLIVVIRVISGGTINGVTRTPGWYAAILGTFALSMFGFWVFAGGVTTSGCSPASVFQQHPIFHILSAFVALFSYLYFASETRSPA